MKIHINSKIGIPIDIYINTSIHDIVMIILLCRFFIMVFITIVITITKPLDYQKRWQGFQVEGLDRVATCKVLRTSGSASLRSVRSCLSRMSTGWTRSGCRMDKALLSWAFLVSWVSNSGPPLCFSPGCPFIKLIQGKGAPWKGLYRRGRSWGAHDPGLCNSAQAWPDTRKSWISSSKRVPTRTKIPKLPAQQAQKSLCWSKVPE